MKILITGATGFIGQALYRTLAGAGHQLIPVIRRRSSHYPDGVVIPNISVSTDWSGILPDVDVVIHLAARVHMQDQSADDPLQLYRAANTAASLNLARSAAEAGVKRLIYLSTIKVNGEETVGQPFRDSDESNPSDPYAISKYEAELAINEVSTRTGLETVIIRPPLVYGPGVRANFLRLLRIADTSLPLPFAAVKNKRSLIGIGNLVNFIQLCLQHPAASGQTFLVSDGDDISTGDLIRIIRSDLDRPARLIKVPASILALAAKALRMGASAQRLLGSLQCDITRTQTLLNWTPPVTVDQEIRNTVEWYKKDVR